MSAAAGSNGEGGGEPSAFPAPSASVPPSSSSLSSSSSSSSGQTGEKRERCDGDGTAAAHAAKKQRRAPRKKSQWEGLPASRLLPEHKKGQKWPKAMVESIVQYHRENDSCFGHLKMRDLMLYARGAASMVVSNPESLEISAVEGFVKYERRAEEARRRQAQLEERMPFEIFNVEIVAEADHNSACEARFLAEHKAAQDAAAAARAEAERARGGLSHGQEREIFRGIVRDPKTTPAELAALAVAFAREQEGRRGRVTVPEDAVRRLAAFGSRSFTNGERRRDDAV